MRIDRGCGVGTGLRRTHLHVPMLQAPRETTTQWSHQPTATDRPQTPLVSGPAGDLLLDGTGVQSRSLEYERDWTLAGLPIPCRI